MRILQIIINNTGAAPSGVACFSRDDGSTGHVVLPDPSALLDLVDAAEVDGLADADAVAAAASTLANRRAELVFWERSPEHCEKLARAVARDEVELRRVTAEVDARKRARAAPAKPKK
jgi:hypothetical protein